MIRLYDYWRSTASYRVRMALHFKQIPFEVQEVHLVKNGGEQHSDWYGEINASHLVPALQLEDGTTVGQSATILQYLEEQFPQPSIFPQGHDRYRALEIAHTIGCDLHPLNNLRVMQYLGTELQVPENQRSDWYEHWLHRGFSAVERKLTQWWAQDRGVGHAQSSHNLEGFAFGEFGCL